MVSLEFRNVVDVHEIERLAIFGFDHLVEFSVEFLAFLSCFFVVPVRVRMGLHIEAPWIFKECFQKQSVNLCGCHLFHCFNFLLDFVEIVVLLPNLGPVLVGFHTDTCIFLLKLVDDPTLI